MIRVSAAAKSTIPREDICVQVRFYQLQSLNKEAHDGPKVKRLE